MTLHEINRDWKRQETERKIDNIGGEFLIQSTLSHMKSDRGRRHNCYGDNDEINLQTS